MALQRGDTGPAVLAAQVLLRVPRTGIFDAITELAVVQLQQNFSLPVNGILDTAEYNAARHGSSHEASGADPVSIGSLTGTSVSAVPNTVPIRDADAGFEVAYLQVDTTPAVTQTGGIGKAVWNETHDHKVQEWQ